MRNAPSRRRRLWRGDLVGVLGAPALTAVALTSPPSARWLIAMGIIAFIAFLALWRPALGIGVFAVYICAQGFLRRVLPATDLLSQLGDPLLFVSPAIAVVLALYRHFVVRRPYTRLERLILVLQALLLVSALNPLGPGPVASLRQFLVVALPMTWLYAAGSLGWWTPARFRALLWSLVGLAVASALYARYQVAFGFPSWDERYIRESGLASLDIGGFIRPFSSYTAASDYSGVLLLGTTAAVVLALSSGHSLVLRLLAAVFAVGLFEQVILVGARGPVVAVVAALTMCGLSAAGVRARYAYPLMIAAGAVALQFTARLGTAAAATDTNGAAVARQIQGFQDPFGEESTLPGHFARLVNGLVEGITNPVGSGVGRIGTAGGTETSYGDLGLALGVLGLIAAFGFVGLIVHTAFTRSVWPLGPWSDPRRLWLVSVVALPFGPLVTAGNYAQMALFYLAVGAALPPRPSQDEGDEVVAAATVDRLDRDIARSRA